MTKIYRREPLPDPTINSSARRKKKAANGL
jgi:hypothetical protein